MNTTQVNNCLKNVKIFSGTYARDSIPKPKKFPVAYVVNTDSLGERGEHWVAIYFSRKKRCEYFDPLGFPPLHKTLTKFINNNKTGTKFLYNSKALQHAETTLCGNFCIAFIKARDKGISFKRFLSMFSRSLKKNASKLIKF